MEREINQETGEVVLRCAQENSVTERYVQPFPLPVSPSGQAEEDRRARKKKRRRIFWIALALTALAVGGFFAIRSAIRAVRLRRFAESYGDFGFYGDWYDWYDEEERAEPPVIERYPNGGAARLVYHTEHGEPLRAQEIYAAVNPCVVTVTVDCGSGAASIGTGVLLTEDGYVLTNAHVLSGGINCYAITSDGALCPARLVGYDAERDLAVLKLEGRGFPAAEFGDSGALEVGEPVYAIGNPLGLELRGTLTDGIVSAINRDLAVGGTQMSVIQTNAALNSGNSGGPLINQYGQVVGINTMKMGNSSVELSVEGLGFALPISEIAYAVNDLIQYGTVREELVIGIAVSLEALTLPDGRTALEIVEVTPGGPGEEAGLQAGDRILSADGRSLQRSGDLIAVRRTHRAGETLCLEIERGGTEMRVDVVLRAAEE